MSEETRPPLEYFHWDSPEYYRWYEYGGKPRKTPLDQEQLSAFLQKERGYSATDAKRAAELSGAQPKEKEQNSVEAVRHLNKEKIAPAAKQKNSGKNTADLETGAQQVETQEAVPESYRKSTDLPASIQKHYLQVGDKFFYDKHPDQLAFRDKGHKLLTKSSGAMIAASLIQIAKARGWTEIKVRGSDDFRRNIWLKASEQGLEVKGYEPKGSDLAVLAKRLKPIDHTELKEKEALPVKQPGIEKEQPVGHPERSTKAKAIRDSRPEKLVKDYPDLKNEAATVKIAEKIAERFPKKADQKRFMSQVKNRVADRVEKGQQSPQIKVREVRQMQKAQVSQIQKR
ncbi:hypothetical protein SAMN02745165_02791 [Malonomonas rubra DSM 5091]|uniref:Large polyvalent protein-associated domain-containing protein n=1 Tax=Malonomonas rubra DSM 5091 TaxID=1122189 RepID=A0A1M6KTA4_MALRU|nr:LPD7 domain-containing protein [Malonomonas rubra]SHJ62198.1 hypothetical protein SAMN02745165_02791 [Malonomonas rubra DSM 5091]